MIQLLFVSLFSLLNFLRGRGYLSRYFCVALMAIVAEFIAFQPLLIPIIFIGMWIGFSFGWGKYFAVFTGNMDTIKETEVRPIDWFLNKALGIPETVRELKIWSFFAMTLRGSFFYPTYAALAYLYHTSYLYGLGVFSIGIVYSLMNLVPQKYAVMTAEIIYGAILGGLISLVTQHAISTVPV